MNGFKDLVRMCRLKKINRKIFNASQDHALILFRELLNEAVSEKHDVRIVTGHMGELFYGQLEQEFEKCLESDINIKIVVLNPNRNYEVDPIVEKIRAKNKNWFIIQSVTDKKVGDQFPHYILVGNKCYRLETDHNQAKAVANFNNPNIGTFLLNNFNNLEKVLCVNNLKTLTNRRLNAILLLWCVVCP